MALNSGYTYREQLGSRAAGLDALAYLSRFYRHSSAEVWRERLLAGQVWVGASAAAPNTPLNPGQVLAWQRPPWEEEDVPLHYATLHRDAELLAVSKPSGLPTLPAGGFLEHTLLHVVRQDFPGAAPLHRLGRGTSGLVLFALTPLAAATLARDWRQRRVTKVYRALASGLAQQGAYNIDVPIGPVAHPRLGSLHAALSTGKAALSVARVLERRPSSAPPTTLFEVDIETGRPHQIRIHLAAVGLPLLGDPLYGPGGAPRGDVVALPGELGYWLHATSLTVRHPVSGATLELYAPPPPQLSLGYSGPKTSGA